MADLPPLTKKQIAMLDLSIADMEEKGLQVDDFLPNANTVVVAYVAGVALMTVAGAFCSVQASKLGDLRRCMDDSFPDGLTPVPDGPDGPDVPDFPTIDPDNPFPIDPRVIEAMGGFEAKGSGGFASKGSQKQPTLGDLIELRKKLYEGN